MRNVYSRMLTSSMLRRIALWVFQLGYLRRFLFARALPVGLHMTLYSVLTTGLFAQVLNTLVKSIAQSPLLARAKSLSAKADPATSGVNALLVFLLRLAA